MGHDKEVIIIIIIIRSNRKIMNWKWESEVKLHIGLHFEDVDLSVRMFLQ